MNTFCGLLKKMPIGGIIICLCCTACATQHGRQGASVGALTGATAGALLDSDNSWRGAMIGGSLGAIFGGTLTDQSDYYRHQPLPDYNTPPNYYNQQHSYTHYRQYPPYRSGYNATARGAAVGGLTGAAAGALLDHDNSWRGSLIGGALGAFFGGSIGTINSSPGIPILQP